MVFTLADKQVATDLPAWVAEGFRHIAQLLKRGGISLTQLDVLELDGVVAETNQMVRAAGTDTVSGNPWTNMQIRATRGNRMVEFVLRNVSMTDEEIVSIINDTLDQVA